MIFPANSHLSHLFLAWHGVCNIPFGPKKFTALSLGNQFQSIGIKHSLVNANGCVVPDEVGITQREESGHVCANEIFSIGKVNGSQSFNSKGCSRGRSGNSCMGYRDAK
jgi:hypothetical protein